MSLVEDIKREIHVNVEAYKQNLKIYLDDGFDTVDTLEYPDNIRKLDNLCFEIPYCYLESNRMSELIKSNSDDLTGREVKELEGYANVKRRELTEAYSNAHARIKAKCKDILMAEMVSDLKDCTANTKMFNMFYDYADSHSDTIGELANEFDEIDVFVHDVLKLKEK